MPVVLSNPIRNDGGIEKHLITTVYFLKRANKHSLEYYATISSPKRDIGKTLIDWTGYYQMITFNIVNRMILNF